MTRMLATALSLLFVTALALGYSSGPPQGYAGDPPGNNNCTFCHNSFPVNSGDGTQTITELTEYIPGETYTLEISISDPGQSRWGFQLTAKDGDNQFAGILENVDGNAQPNGNYINHTSQGTQLGEDMGTWTVEWWAPDEGVGDVTFYLANNAANGNFNDQGDYIYTTSVTVPEGGGDPYDIIATPINDVVPASGGTITYSLEVWTELPNPFPGVTYWTTAELPNGNETGPLFMVTTTIPPFADIFVPQLSQDVPGFAPAGDYIHKSKLGIYPFAVIESWFSFTKQAAGANPTGEPVDEWAAHGWPAELTGATAGSDVSALPAEYELREPYPNPFNATTKVTVELPETAELTLRVYNVLGSVVATITEGAYSAGSHTFSFDARELSSGIYFIHAHVPGELNRIQKVTLVK